MTNFVKAYTFNTVTSISTPLSVAEQRPYRLGIALSGGGARGIAHAGALKAIEEAGLCPDIIAGVSAGAVVSALYAAGMEPELFPRLFSSVSFANSCELSVNSGGLFRIRRFANLLTKALGDYRLLEQLPLPTVVCATDLDSGVAVAFDSGEIAPRVIASCSIPVLFHPTVIDGVAYVDGGVLRNLPAWAIRDKCERLIGINCSPMVRSHHKNTILDVAHRSYQLMAKTNVLPDLAMCDLVVETRDIANHRVFSTKEMQRVYDSGYQSAIEALTANGWI